MQSKKAFVFPIRLFKDNYCYLVLSNTTRSGFLIDPADPGPVVKFLRNFPNFKALDVLYTHKHWDHAGKADKMYSEIGNAYPGNQPVFWISKEDGKFVDCPLSTFSEVRNFKYFYFFIRID